MLVFFSLLKLHTVTAGNSSEGCRCKQNDHLEQRYLSNSAVNLTSDVGIKKCIPWVQPMQAEWLSTNFEARFEERKPGSSGYEEQWCLTFTDTCVLGNLLRYSMNSSTICQVTIHPRQRVTRIQNNLSHFDSEVTTNPTPCRLVEVAKSLSISAWFLCVCRNSLFSPFFFCGSFCMSFVGSLSSFHGFIFVWDIFGFYLKLFSCWSLSWMRSNSQCELTFMSKPWRKVCCFTIQQDQLKIKATVSVNGDMSPQSVAFA